MVTFTIETAPTRNKIRWFRNLDTEIDGEPAHFLSELSRAGKPAEQTWVCLKMRSVREIVLQIVFSQKIFWIGGRNLVDHHICTATGHFQEMFPRKKTCWALFHVWLPWTHRFSFHIQFPFPSFNHDGGTVTWVNQPQIGKHPKPPRDPNINMSMETQISSKSYACVVGELIPSRQVGETTLEVFASPGPPKGRRGSEKWHLLLFMSMLPLDEAVWIRISL